MPARREPPKITKFAPGTKVTATFETTAGTMKFRLFADECPMTVGNFVGLATGETPWTEPHGVEAKRPLYDGTTFHRIIPNFMIQGGDPLGNGTGGPGYRFADEIVATLKHDKPGVLSMANAGPDTNGSQFFITEVPTPWLDGKHTVFGEIVDGTDVMMTLAKSPTGPGDRPDPPVKLNRVTIETTTD